MSIIVNIVGPNNEVLVSNVEMQVLPRIDDMIVVGGYQAQYVKAIKHTIGTWDGKDMDKSRISVYVNYVK
jgi:hypothetical protein